MTRIELGLVWNTDNDTDNWTGIPHEQGKRDL